MNDATIGAELRARRKALGMSQRQTGRLLGADTAQMSRWESGKRPISAALFFRWCRVLGLRVTVEKVKRGKRA